MPRQEQDLSEMLDDLVWRVGTDRAFVERVPLIGQDHQGSPLVFKSGRVWWKLGARREALIDAFHSASLSRKIPRADRRRLSRYAEELKSYMGTDCEETLWAVITLANHCLNSKEHITSVSDKTALQAIGEELTVAAVRIGRERVAG